MLKIAYGESDFAKIVKGNFFYQDRTHYIPELENYGGSYQLFLRPRRFGKSLFTSVLEYYYGIQYKEEFKDLFGKYYIGQHPTPLANQYMILRFDFSGINTTSEVATAQGFLDKVRIGMDQFFTNYPKAFSKEQRKMLLEYEHPNLAAMWFFSFYRANYLKPKIYILVDEYDHFTNELVSFNLPYFGKAVGENGFVRKFYEIIKQFTGTGGSTVDRMFITGVSPLTLDSMTSGFNIATNLTMIPTFYELMGFTETEVLNILKNIKVPDNQLVTVLGDVKTWYDGYLFGRYHTEHLYNPNMVLYFAQEYQRLQRYPEILLDANIASDYVKIRNLFNIQGNREQFAKVLKLLTEVGIINSRLVPMFNMERAFGTEDLVSLLFYMGFLTIQREELGSYHFTFPNYVIRKLYNNYFFELMARQTELPIDNSEVNDAIQTIALRGDPALFFKQVEQIVLRMSPKDIGHFNENSLKAIVISLLHQQNFYYVHTEYESDWTFMDIFLEPIRGYKVNFEVAMELKYALKGGRVATDTLFKSAATQLRGYLASEKFKNRIALKSYVVIVVGNKLQYKLLEQIK
jgi:Predicted AAA-ATPase/PD-(D/E)XK nuclease superfamily